MNNDLPTSRADCETLDRDDPLAPRRDLFELPEGTLYLDGHSLGAMTRSARDRVEQATTDEWGLDLIRSWNNAGWIDLAKTTGDRIAELIGAQAGEVIVADSVSTNLFKLAAAALGITRTRTVIVEEDEFPTDQYMAQGLARISGADLRQVPGGDGLSALQTTGGVLIKSVVNYRTAAIANVSEGEAIAEQSGGAVVWDLSHATGVLDIDMSAARLAVGCTYKYLNGGPGAPAFLYARQDMAGRLETLLPGWMGHAHPFTFSSTYEPADGVARFANGTPPILSLSALAGALNAFDGARMEDLELKARSLGDLCLARAEALGLRTSSPGIGERRGGHVTLHHEEGYAIVQALIARGMIGDFRAPDGMRFGFSPLYVQHTDVWDTMDALEAILETGSWDQPQFKARAAVT